MRFHPRTEISFSFSVSIKYVNIKNVNGNIIGIEEYTKTTLACKTSEGRPAANITWKKISKKGFITDLTKNAKYHISRLESGITIAESSIDLKPKREDNGSRIICEAINKISNVTKKEVTLHVQYPPGKPYFQFFAQNEFAIDGKLLQDKLIVKEGSHFIVICKSDGDPSPICTWAIENDPKSPNLTFTNITKKHRGSYECIAGNVIKTFPEGETTDKESTAGLVIDVLYQSKIIRFNVIGIEKTREHFEVTENETIVFICSVDSNPASSISISFKQRELGRNENTKSLVQIKKVNSCFDNGVYQCLAHNKCNDKPSLENLTLLVRCRPLLLPEFDLEPNITSAQNATVTFEFKALAHPTPEFQWFKLSGSTWKTMLTDNKSKIKTLEHYSSLSLSNITEDDYGRYRLRIQNEIGFLEQLYFLNAYGKPDPSTMFAQLREYVTEASAILQWKPGFDGGSEQMFILRYKLESEKNWTKIMIPDTGDETMHYSLIYLESDSVYHSELISVNSHGKSMPIKLTFKTKAKQQTVDSTTTWTLICVSAGSFAVSIFAVVVTFLCCKFTRQRNTRTMTISQTAEVIPENQNQTTFYLDGINTIHEYEQLDGHSLEDREYTEMQTIKAGDDSNRDYLTPTI
ncbi:nephrin-like [Ruditapes philippinarum]|uniref:nephrin-like n=1 Tax=Ruditapes philippinarum TaxID=129788 RepID=UPI00295AACB2|nr:nephrin-like [Ruditapes philippinarum]